MTACPAPFVLAAFVRGALDEAVAGELEVHVDGCEGCRRGLGALVRGQAVPSTLGRYRLGPLLGAGGMGIVYRAEDPALGRAVAIKVVRPRGEDDLGPLGDRLAQEARLLAQIRHPNVCQVFDVGREAGEVWLAMELVEGETLRAWLRGPHQRDARLDVVLQLGRALAAAHGAGVCHGDLKPENVLVEHGGRVVVTDFGLGRALDDAGARVVAGTPAYLAPEQRAGRPADERSDQHAFCQVAREVLRAPAPWLEAILERGGARDPARRFASMAALVALVERRRGRRRRTVAIAVGATLAIAAGGAGLTLGTRAAGDAAPCDGAGARPAGAWVAGGNLSLPAAASVHLRLALDVRATSWSAQRVASCHATYVDGTRERADHDLALGCLDRAAVQEAALLARLRAASPDHDALVTALLALPPPSACGDLGALRASNEGVAHVPEEIAQVAALEVGADPAARIAAEALLARVPAVPAVLRARLHLVVARSLVGERGARDALAALDLAQSDALRAAAPALVAEIALERVLRGLHADGNLAAARGALRLADVLVRQAGDPPRLRARVDELAGTIALGLEDGAAAIAALARARAAHLALDGPYAITTLAATARLAQAHAAAGELDTAGSLLRQVLAAELGVLGDRHVEVAATRVLLAQVLRRAARHDEATAQLERAIAAFEVREPLDRRFAPALLEQGRAAHDRGRLDDAERAYRRALATTTEPDAAAADLRALYGLGYVEVGRARWGAAIGWFDRALEGAAGRVGLSPRFGAGVQLARCVVLENLERAADAELACAAALATYTAFAPPHDRDRLDATWTAAQHHAAHGRRARARELAERARAGYEALGDRESVAAIDAFLAPISRR